jgi:hypothetical protein
MLIEEKYHFNIEEFKEHFLNRKAVVYRKQTCDWAAAKKWGPDYFKEHCPDIPVVVKTFGLNTVNTQNMSMKEYVELMRTFQAEHGNNSDKIGPYCHDIPIFLLCQKLVEDIGNFPKTVLSAWYAEQWWRYVQFFMSPKGAVTPLHFDTLMTHNLFFQIAGSKCFTLIEHKDYKYCYRRGWRWFNVDPENPDLTQFKEYDRVRPGQVLVNAGDIIYMPPGMLHHVRSLDDCISFNIDFHNLSSVIKAFLSIPKGMPKENIYYNYVSFKALLKLGGSEELFAQYKGYLNYIS